ncbi:MAG TPA: hypothetical protein VGS07_32915 [Thermoanaerobaculia bacterium]|jgi:hypothetical protein|nr:hypothetical protein [Thermoanaerobaculia bacterium]
MIRSARFRATIFLLILALAAIPAMAAGKAPARQNAPSLVTRLWQALGSLVPWMAKGRGSMDPNGSPPPTAPAGSTPDGRDGMDPDGRDGMDPNG